MFSKKGQLEDINLLGVIGGIFTGFICIIVTNNMEGGILLKVMGFGLGAVIGYFLTSKILDD